MRAITKIYFVDDNGEKFFGEGPYQLLKEVKKTHSLRSAAASMGMAYTKALKIIKNAENALGFPLTLRQSGGSKGGGSELTKKGLEWLEKYESYKTACQKENAELYEKFFKKTTGCVIMASGEGKRFGSNKLLTPFKGKPMAEWVMDLTEGVFEKRVVVTRHSEIASLALSKGIDVVLHSLPGRNDTIRLGLEKLGKVKSCVFLPCDQPLIKKETLEKFKEECLSDFIVRAKFENDVGMPCLFPEEFFEELKSLPEGNGGNYVIKKHPDRVKYIQCQNAYELRDIDTKEDMEEMEKVL